MEERRNVELCVKRWGRKFHLVSEQFIYLVLLLYKNTVILQKYKNKWKCIENYLLITKTVLILYTGTKKMIKYLLLFEIKFKQSWDNLGTLL